MSPTQGRIGVVTDAGASDVVNYAAEELLEHIEKVLGFRAPRSKVRSGLTIILGQPALTVIAERRPELVKKLMKMTAESFAIDRVDENVLIAG